MLAIPFKQNCSHGHFVVGEYNVVRYVSDDGNVFEKHGVHIIKDGFAKFVMDINGFKGKYEGYHEPYESVRMFWEILKNHIETTCPKAL